MQTQPTQLDPQVINLAKAIRQTESGGNFKAVGKSGEYGAYQYTQPTWDADSKKYLGTAISLKSATPEQQNEVAYKKLLDLKGQGYNPGQIASIWNSGKPEWEGNVGVNSQGVAYDTPKYVNSVTSAYQQLKGGAQNPTIIPNPSTVAPDEAPSVSGFIGNAFSSAGNLVSGLASAVMHPVQTAKTALGTIAGAVEKPFGIDNEDTKMFDNAVGFLKDRYGGDSLSQVMSNIAHTAYTDPIGMALDLSTVLDGVGAGISATSKVSKVAELSKAADLIKQASELINPIAQGGKMASKAASLTGDIVRSGSAKLIGLNKAEDVSQIINNYQEYSKQAINTASRESLAEEFAAGLDKLDEARGEGGAMFGNILKANEGKVIPVPDNWISDVLKNGTSVVEEGGKNIPFKLGLKEDSNGRLIVEADTKSFTRDQKDLSAIQNFVDTWGKKTELTAEEFKNMRDDLSKMSKFGRELGKSDAAELVSKALRADANKTIRPHVTGLKEHDLTQAPLINESNRARKDFLQKDPTGGYSFKDGAINKIANATGKGKDLLLQRMEQITPGITERIKIMKTIESIKSAYDMKTGTYLKDIVGAGALLHGNIPTVIAAIVSQPSIAIPLLRGLGWTKAQIAPMLKFLETYVNSSSLRNASVVTNAIAGSNEKKPIK